jgi:HK97 family phage major capsid protein
MTSTVEHMKALDQTRQRVWEEGKALLESASRRHPGYDFDPEERSKWDRINERIDDLDAEIRALRDRELRERDSATAREAFERQYGSTDPSGGSPYDDRAEQEAAQLRRWALGEGPKELNIDLRAARRQHEAIRQGADGRELRSLLWDTGSAGSLVPTLLADTIYGYLEAGIAAFRMGTTKITTAGGGPMQWPRLNTHSVATQVSGQGTALAGTDPSFLRMQLDAYKYGELVLVASEVIQDASIDMVSFLGSDLARAVARQVDAALVAGSGSSAPQGMTTAVTVGAAGTVATGGSLITPTYDNLVTLLYSVNDQYRQSPSCAWLMCDSTAGTLRKLRSEGTIGLPMWNPATVQGLQFGQPPTLLGYPVFTDPNVASMASNNKIVHFGDWRSYYVRESLNFTLERSDDAYFSTDTVAIRGKGRWDGEFIDLTAVNRLRQAVGDA